MSSNILGQPFDIHGGGMDLKFPHHENEIAQSEAALEKKYANYWMHVGLLEVDNVKMSKSLGNFFTIRDVLAKYPAEELRYFMLSGHYRSPLNYSEDNLAQVHQSLTTLYTALRDLPDAAENNTERFHESFNAAMDDDFNTPVAFATLFEMAREINRLRKQNKIEEAAGLAAGLREFGKILGFLQQDPNHYLQGRHAENDIDNIENLIAARKTAREQKNWQEADRIREQLSTMGIIIEDNSTGTHWRRE
jgi:cysteinyl-tRNA synthetase